MSSGITRRSFLPSLTLGTSFSIGAQVRVPLQKKPKLLPESGEFTRIIDPITENTIVRLTTIGSTSVLPFARNRFVSARERTLIFSSDRTGRFTPHQIDLRTGVIRQLADSEKLSPRTLCFDRQERTFRYLDGESLFEAALNHGTPKRIGDGYTAFSLAGDGSLFAIVDGKLIRKDGNGVRTLADAASEPIPQPNSAGCLFARSKGPEERELYYVAGEGASRPQLLASGRLTEPCWDADGESILFLRDVAAPSGVVLAELHGISIRGGEEHLVETTSQFACFSANNDATVFVGASRSHAQPNVVLMLRSPHREMTLCEHHSSHPRDVSPAFSPDNRRVYFESDREGHSAIYSVNVELLVEPSSADKS